MWARISGTNRGLGRAAVVVTVLVVTWALPYQPGASAFTPDVAEYMGTIRWDTSTAITWNFAENFPGFSYRDRVRDAFRSWNGMGEPLQFAANPGPDVPEVPPIGSNCTSNPRRVILWKPIPGSIIGKAGNCQAFRVEGTTVVSRYNGFDIVVDSSATWWTNTGDIPEGPPYSSDLWSLASHEIGHVTGINQGGIDEQGHFDNDNPHVCPVEWWLATFAERETMCQSTIADTRVGRTPDDHDLHLFRNAY